MKNLSEYMGQAQDECFIKHGAFFSFSDSQFKTKAFKCVRYASLGMGLYAPAVNAVQLREDLKSIYESAIETDLKENGIEGVIKRELDNHEYSYTNDLHDTIEALSSYKPVSYTHLTLPTICSV